MENSDPVPSSTELSKVQVYLNKIDTLSSYIKPPLRELLQNGEYAKAIDVASNATPDDASKMELLSILYSYLFADMKISDIKVNILDRIKKVISNLLPKIQENRLDSIHQIEQIAVLHAEKLSSKIENSIDTGDDYGMWSGSVELYDLISNYFKEGQVEIFCFQKESLRKVVEKFGNTYLSDAGYIFFKANLSPEMDAKIMDMISTYKRLGTLENISGIYQKN